MKLFSFFAIAALCAQAALGFDAPAALAQPADQADQPLDTQYHFSQTGAGATAFIIDTGIRADHVEFTGRVLAGYDTVGRGLETAPPSS